MEFHEVANIFPLMQGDDFDALVASVKKNGLREPIKLYEGKILDGRNRYNACIRAEVEPRYEDWQGDDPWEFVWDTNRKRRHLPAGQLQVIEVKYEHEHGLWLAGRERIQREKAEQPRTEQGTFALRESSSDDSRDKPKTKKKKGKKKKGAITKERAEALYNARPDLAEQVAQGTISLGEANRQRKRDDLKDKTPETPDGKYRIIYADPPWKYNNSGDGIDQYGPAERHYPAMSIIELETMGVIIKEMSEDNSILFLWTTSPMLEDSFRVIRAWGFKYKTSFVWDKVKHNFGHYNSVRHEFLLVCTRGNCTPDCDEKIDSVQSIKRSAKHSEKPEEFRAIIDKLYPNGSRIELFRRGDTPKNWHVWGNEC